MNMFCGKMVRDEEARELLPTLGERILETKEGDGLNVSSVIRACDRVSGAIDEKRHLPLLTKLGIPEERARRMLREVRWMLSEAYLINRLERERIKPMGEFTPYGLHRPVRQELAPLGTLFHIPAGNADALPAMSVLEGLLTGNINLLKLPSEGDALSMEILNSLVEAAPELGEYLYAFSLPSTDLATMKTLAAQADAIVVWGGDRAIKGVRSLAEANVKIIEWGRKISFAYVSGKVGDAELAGIAYHICDTNQLLCSACQGIFLDTPSFEETVTFAQHFSELLEEASRGARDDLFLSAQKTLELYTEELESQNGSKRVFRKPHCSVTAYRDNRLELSHMYRNCWVKPLPQEAIVRALSGCRGYLQTVALLCDGDREPIEKKLIRAGVVRITSGEQMSRTYCGMPHDGEFSLMRYRKVVSLE